MSLHCIVFPLCCVLCADVLYYWVVLFCVHCVALPLWIGCCVSLYWIVLPSSVVLDTLKSDYMKR